MNVFATDIESKVVGNHCIDCLDICWPHDFLKKLELHALISCPYDQAKQNVEHEQVSSEVSARQFDHARAEEDDAVQMVKRF